MGDTGRREVETRGNGFRAGGRFGGEGGKGVEGFIRPALCLDGITD